MFDFLKKKKTIPAESKKPGAFQVIRIEDSGSIHESLGITNERANELGAHANRMYHSSTNMVEAASKTTEICTHQNEMFMVTMILTDIHLKNMQMNSMLRMFTGDGK